MENSNNIDARGSEFTIIGRDHIDIHVTNIFDSRQNSRHSHQGTSNPILLHQILAQRLEYQSQHSRSGDKIVPDFLSHEGPDQLSTVTPTLPSGCIGPALGGGSSHQSRASEAPHDFHPEDPASSGDSSSRHQYPFLSPKAKLERRNREVAQDAFASLKEALSSGGQKAGLGTRASILQYGEQTLT